MDRGPLPCAHVLVPCPGEPQVIPDPPLLRSHGWRRAVDPLERRERGQQAVSDLRERGLPVQDLQPEQQRALRGVHAPAAARQIHPER